MGFDPVSMIVATGAKALLSSAAQNAKADAQDKVYNANVLAAGKAGEMQAEVLNLNTQNKIASLAGQNLAAQIESAKKVALMSASAAESGVGGNSSTVLANAEAAAGYQAGTTYQNMVSQTQTQAILEARGVDAATLNRINAVPRGTHTSFLTEFAGGMIGAGANSLLERTGKSKLSKDNSNPLSSAPASLTNALLIG